MPGSRRLAVDRLGRGILSSTPSRRVWASYRRRQQLAAYRRRRERYARLAEARGIAYREGDVAGAVRERMRRRGYQPTRRALGDVHTFAVVPRIGWHDALIADLAELGPVTEFDYASHGYKPCQFEPSARRAVERRQEMNDLVLRALRSAHRERAVDWVFVYASGLEITTTLLRDILDEVGVPLVNMCLDDKQSWEGPRVGGQRLGQIDIAPLFDVSWTSARLACEWYLAVGSRPIYLPEGFDQRMYRPLGLEKDLPVSFIGNAYGFRPAVIRDLRKGGVEVHVFGEGWGTRPVWGQGQVEVIDRSVVNLGMGGIGYNEWLTNVKTRDFEIAGAGGGVYLTTYNADLAQHFSVGQEILCYASHDELVELVRHCLRNVEESHAIAVRGRQRCLAEHRWFHRYQRILEVLGVVSSTDHDHG